MKVDILMPTGRRGGVENVVNMLLSYLEKKGCDVRVVQLVWEGDEWTKPDTFYPLLRGMDGHDLEEFVDSYREFVVKNGAPDIVLATNWPYMCYVAKKASVQLGICWKVISWLHNPLECYEASGYGGYEALALADIHFAISRKIADGIRQNLAGSCVVEVRNPVKMPPVSTEERISALRGEGSSKHRLFFAARITPQKRLDIVIKALAKVKDWTLTVVGEAEEDSYMAGLRRLAEDEGVAGRIEWLGWQQNPWECAKPADYFVMASDYEGFPLTAIESLAHGFPVIATPVSGITELIKPGVNGYLFPLRDSGALAEVLTYISDGTLPAIEPQACIASAQPYSEENALGEFWKALSATGTC